jgi:hypothetical protein
VGPGRVVELIDRAEDHLQLAMREIRRDPVNPRARTGLVELQVAASALERARTALRRG